MSRVYFHSEHGDAELHGSERAWLHSLASGPAESAWDLDSTRGVERAEAILAMVPEVPDGAYGANYLHRYLREAIAERDRSKAAWVGWKAGQPHPYPPYDPEPGRRLTSALAVSLRVQGVALHVAGVDLESANVDLNTALVAGSDPVRLAAKIHGWCESHCWVEGPERKWLAGLIDDGLRTGLYRRGLWYADQPDGPLDKWSDQGWGQVTELLRSRDDGPVVLSYSVCDRFPNRDIAGWTPPPMPAGWEPGWADTDEGHAEWERDYPTPEDKAAHYQDTARDQWYDLPADEQWRQAMDGLRADRPWARLAPDTLTEVTFSYPVSVYDLLAPDRDERVRAAAAAADQTHP